MSELSEKAREIRRAYKRDWNRKNRDKVAAAQKRYWERRAKEAEAEAEQGDLASSAKSQHFAGISAEAEA